MKPSAKVLLLGLLILFLLGILAHAQTPIDDDYEEGITGSGIKDVLVENAQKLEEKLEKIVLNPPPFNLDQAYDASKQSGQRLKDKQAYRRESQEDLYTRNNDPKTVYENAGVDEDSLYTDTDDYLQNAGDYATETYDSLKGKVKDLYDDASTTWGNWKDKLSAKLGKGDQLPSEEEQFAREKFEDSIADFKHYVGAFEESKDFPEAIKGRIARFVTDVRNNYDALKDAAQKKWEQATQDTKETVNDQAQDLKDNLAKKYDDASSRFSRSSKRLKHEMNYLTGKIDEESYQKGTLAGRGYEKIKEGIHDAADVGATTYENLKDRIQGLASDAANTLSDWKDKLARKVQGTRYEPVTEEEQLAREHFEDSIADFQHYLETYERDGPNLTDDVRGKLNSIFQDLQFKYKDFKDAAKRKFSYYTRDAKENIKDNAEEANVKLQDNYEDIKNRYHDARKRARAELDYVTGKINKEQYEAATTIKDTARKAGDKVKDAAESAADYTKDTYESLKNKFSDLYDDATSSWSSWQDKLAAKLSSSPSDTKLRHEGDLFQKALKELGEYKKLLEGKPKYDDETLRGKLAQAFDDLKTNYNKYKEEARNKFESLKDDAKDAVKEGKHDTKDKAEDAYLKAQWAFNESRDRLKNDLHYLYGKVTKSQYEEAVEKAKNSLKDGWEKAKKAIEL